MMGKIKHNILYVVFITAVASLLVFTKISGRASKAAGIFDDAYAQHQENLKRAPHAPENLYNEAWYAAQQQDFKSALKRLDQAIQYLPKGTQHAERQAKYIYTRAWLHKKLEQPALAQQDLQKAQTLQWTPEDFMESLRLYLIQGTSVSYKKGRDQLEREIAKHLAPSTGLYYLRSLFHHHLKDYAAAQKDLKNIENTAAFNTLSNALHTDLLTQRSKNAEMQKQYKQAFKDLQAALALDKSLAAKNKERLLSLHIKAHPEQGLIALKQLMHKATEPKKHRLEKMYLESLLDNKKYETAKKHLIAARNKAPENAELWSLQARYQMGQKQFSNALISLQEASKSAKTTEAKMVLSLENFRLMALQKQTQKAKTYWQAHPELQHLELDHPDFKTLKKPAGFLP